MAHEIILVIPNIVQNLLEVFFVQFTPTFCACQSQCGGHDVSSLASVKAYLAYIFFDPLFDMFHVLDAFIFKQWVQIPLEDGYGLRFTQLAVFDGNVDAGLNGNVEVGNLVCGEHQEYVNLLMRSLHEAAEEGPQNIVSWYDLVAFDIVGMSTSVASRVDLTLIR